MLSLAIPVYKLRRAEYTRGTRRSCPMLNPARMLISAFVVSEEPFLDGQSKVLVPIIQGTTSGVILESTTSIPIRAFNSAAS